MATNSEIMELIAKYGDAKAKVAVGDTVLTEGSASEGNYIILGEVVGLGGTHAEIAEKRQYFFNGNERGLQSTDSCELAYFSESIATHWRKGEEVLKRLALGEDEPTG